MVEPQWVCLQKYLIPKKNKKYKKSFKNCVKPLLSLSAVFEQTISPPNQPAPTYYINPSSFANHILILL